MREEHGKLISAEALKQKVPLPNDCLHLIGKTKDEIQEVLTGTSNKKIVVIGPCSADFEDSLLEYGRKLKQMKEKYGDKIIFVMRFYTGKPRTIGGWKGIQQGPLDSSSTDESQTSTMNSGLIYSRELAIKLMQETGIALADEMLHPQLYNHFDDIYAYQAIGARSTENQYHREVSSGASMPIGFKNPTGGNLQVMVNSILAGQTQSTYTIGENIYTSTGNLYSHGILRGSDLGPNYSLENIQKTYEIMLKGGVKNPSIIIDCSHENCKVNGKKDPLKQVEVMEEVLRSIQDQEHLKRFIVGFMVESYIYDGNQAMPKNEMKVPEMIANGQIIKGQSLTDPCIGISRTEELISSLHSKI